MNRKKQPKRVRFFLADDIRSDGPKPLVLGLFVDDMVLLDLPSEPTQEKPVALQSITILASFIDCSGSFKAETSLYGPDGSAIFEGQEIDGGIETTGETTPLKNMNLVLRFSPFTVSTLGLYKLDIKLDKKTYSYEFKILRKQ